MTPSAPWHRVVLVAPCVLAPLAWGLSACARGWMPVEPGGFSTQPGVVSAAAIVGAIVLPFCIGGVTLKLLGLERGRPTAAYNAVGTALLVCTIIGYMVLFWIVGLGGNAMFDTSVERLVPAKVVRVYTTRGKSSVTWWELRGDFDPDGTLTIPAVALGEPPVTAGTRLEVRLREGRLGFAWGWLRRSP